MNPYNIIDLKAQVEYLNELAETPDIRLMTSSCSFGKIRLRAELVLPSGEMIVSEKFYDDCQCDEKEENELRDYIQDQQLRDIGYNFIKRAYEKRKSGKCQVDATNYCFSMKNLKERERLLKKLISLCVVLCNNQIGDEVVEEIATVIKQMEVIN